MRKSVLACICFISFVSVNGNFRQRKRSLSIEDLNNGKKEFLYTQQISQNCKRSHPILEQVQNIFDLDLGQIDLSSIDGIETMLIDFINPNTQEWQTIQLEDLLSDFAHYTGCLNPEITIFLDENDLQIDLLPKAICIGNMTFKLFSFVYMRHIPHARAIRYEFSHNT